MSLTQTLFTGLSGIDSNQTRLNVTGNNIANVNTVGFKSSRALFKPQFYVTDSSGSPPGGEFGGTNPSQRGLGASVATIQKDFSAGSIEPTGKSTDLAIEGGGFFIVSNGGDQLYTRDGSFQINQNNELVNTGGAYVQGWKADENGNIVRGALEKLEIPIGGASKAQATETALMRGTLNTEGAIATGATLLRSQNIEVAGATPVAGDLLTNVEPQGGGTPLFAVGDVLTLDGQKGEGSTGELTFTVTAGSTLNDLQNFFQQGLGINVGAPSSGALTAGAVIEDSGAGAFGRLTILGNRGEANKLRLGNSGFTSTNPAMNMQFTDGDAFGETSGAIGEGVRTTIPVYDSLGSTLMLDVSMTLESTSGTGTTWRYQVESKNDTDFTFADGDSDDGRLITNGLIQFDTEGRVLGQPNVDVDLDRVDTGSGTPLSVSLDFSQVSAVAAESLLNAQPDGLKAGTLSTFSIGDNGIITGTYSNGLKESLGQIAIAGFDNPEGLEDEGGNLFRNAANSGEAQILAPTEGLGGKIRTGALELSNVDLSSEFINMIVSSTGFSAASRVISTSDDLLTELINSTR